MKRGALEQGRKETGLDTGADDRAEDPRRTATQAQMSRRNIKQPKGRLHGSRSATPPNFALQQAIGNPFGTVDPNTVNNPPQFNSMDATQKPNSTLFTFGGGNSTTQSFPPNNNSANQQPFFGGPSNQSVSFPTPQNNTGSIFGSSTASTGFTFGSTPTNNNPFAPKPATNDTAQTNNTPGFSTTSQFNFGITTNQELAHERALNGFNTSGSEGQGPDFGNTVFQPSSTFGTTGSVGIQRPKSSTGPENNSSAFAPKPFSNQSAKRNVDEAGLNGDQNQISSNGFGNKFANFGSNQDANQPTGFKTPFFGSNPSSQANQTSFPAPPSSGNAGFNIFGGIPASDNAGPPQNTPKPSLFGDSAVQTHNNNIFPAKQQSEETHQNIFQQQAAQSQSGNTAQNASTDQRQDDTMGIGSTSPQHNNMFPVNTRQSDQMTPPGSPPKHSNAAPPPDFFTGASAEPFTNAQYNQQNGTGSNLATIFSQHATPRPPSSTGTTDLFNRPIKSVGTVESGITRPVDATSPKNPATQPASNSEATTQQNRPLKRTEYDDIRSLNRGFRHFIEATDPRLDWSPIMSAYLSQVEMLNSAISSDSANRGLDHDEPSLRGNTATQSTAKSDLSAPSAVSPSKLQSMTANLFQSIVEGGKTSSTSDPSITHPQSTQQAPAQPLSQLFKTAPESRAASRTDPFAPKSASHANQPSVFGRTNDASDGATADSGSQNATGRKASRDDDAPPNPFARIPSPTKPSLFAPQSKSSTNGDTSSDARPASSSKYDSEPPSSHADYDSSEDDGETLEAEIQRKHDYQNGNASNSLFNRTTPADSAMSGDQTQSLTAANAPAGPKSIFGQSSPAPSNLFSKSTTDTSTLFGTKPTTSDHTWKGQESSPIKFGSSVNGTASYEANPFANTTNNDTSSTQARPFSSLFGLPKSDATPSLFDKPSGSDGAPTSTLHPPTATPSLFSGSAAASRATTPGMDTGASASEAETHNDDAEAPLDQSDLTAPSAEELRTEDIVFEVARARLQQFRKGESDTHPVIGTGPLRLMKNKETGVVRIVARAAPRGNVIVNAVLQSGMKFQIPQEKVVTFGAPDPKGDFRSWFVRIGKAEVAEQLRQDLQNNTPA